MSVQYITGPQASPQIIVVERNTTPKYATGDVPVEFLVPCLGLYCCTTNCYIEQPHCIGYASRCDLLCISCKGMACKLSREEGVCCACQRGTCDITSISSAVLVIWIKISYKISELHKLFFYRHKNDIANCRSSSKLAASINDAHSPRKRIPLVFSTSWASPSATRCNVLTAAIAVWVSILLNRNTLTRIKCFTGTFYLWVLLALLSAVEVEIYEFS